MAAREAIEAVEFLKIAYPKEARADRRAIKAAKQRAINCLKG